MNMFKVLIQCLLVGFLFHVYWDYARCCRDETQRDFGETDLIELLQNFLNFKNFTPSDTDLIAFTSKFQNFPEPTW